MISCLMVTRAERWRRAAPDAVACYLEQRLPLVDRELVIVTEKPLAAMEDLAARNPSIRVVAAHGSLGGLRQRSIREARGELVCQWDDDDIHHAERLSTQFGSLLEQPDADACFLERWTMEDAEGRRYISGRRVWEGSMLAFRSRLPPYHEALGRGEDTDLVSRMDRRRFVLIDGRPELYVYRYHGGNVWDADHWDRLFVASTPI